MDHFSLEEDKLYQAFSAGEMKRSFMGYTTAASSHLLGLGVSSISSTPYGHIQNEKEIADYKARIDKGEFPFFYGHIQNERDKATSESIHDIMCGSLTDLNKLFDVSPQDQREKIELQLKDMLEDQLIEYNEGKLQVTALGLPFIRNISMALDYRLKDTHRFSRTV